MEVGAAADDEAEVAGDLLVEGGLSLGVLGVEDLDAVQSLLFQGGQ